MNKKLFLAAWLALASILPAKAQGVDPLNRLTALGYCQLSAASLVSVQPLANCVQASFTGVGSGTNLTISAVTGVIRIGATISGSGIPVGTTILSQTSGTTGFSGVYVTSAATTVNGATTTVGIPAGATYAALQASTAVVRFRDDGAGPTTSIGFPLNTAAPPMIYSGNLSALLFISTTGVLDVLFYR